MQTNDRSVCFRMCFPSGVHSFASPQRFLFCLRCMYSQCAVCVHQRFLFRLRCMYSQSAVCAPTVLFCLSSYLFSEWHIVPQLYIQIKQSRVYSRKALYECKASRRLGKQIRGLSRFLFNPMPSCHKTEKGGCPRLSILHIRLCLYSIYEATSSLRISPSPSFVFLLSEDSSRHSTYQTLLTILLVSYYHSAQNVYRPMTVAVCNNGVVYMPS